MERDTRYPTDQVRDTRDTKRADMRPNRVTLTIHLYRGEDDDLITVLEKVPMGKRQMVYKKLLRGQQANFDAAAPAASASEELRDMAEQIAWLVNALNEMPAWMETLLSKVTVARPAATSDEPAVSTETLDKRAQRLKASQW